MDFPTTFKKQNTRDYNLNWAREFYQRDQIMRGLENAEADDLIIVSDVDEILSAEKLREALRIRRKYDLTIFENGLPRPRSSCCRRRHAQQPLKNANAAFMRCVARTA